MSLLMQALRTAEKAKKKQAEDAAAEQPAAAAPSAAEAAPASTAEPELLSLQPREATPSERADAAAEASRAAADDAERAPFSEPAPMPAPAPPAPVEEPVDYFSGQLRAPVEAYVPSPAAFAAPPPDETPAPAAPLPPPAAEAPRRVPAPPPIIDNSAALAAAQARTAAGALFAAKQRAQRRRPLIIAGLGLLAVGAVGIYLYLQIAGVGQPPAFVPAPAPTPITIAPVPDPVASATPPVAVVTTTPPAAVAAATQPAVTASAVQPPAAVKSPDAASASAALPQALPAAVPASRPVPIQRAPKPSPDLSLPAPGAAIELRRNDATRQLSPVLSGAWQAFQSGDMVQAQSQYERVLQLEPDNRDALLGLAAIAVNRGQGPRAGSFYARLLELDPLDADAVAGLASLERGDPSQAESRLKKVIAGAPQSGPALFALGNVYAQQGRWAEAQQAYFRAFGATPTSADYAFNLAVSLDRLNQGKLALEYYRRALQLAPAGGSNLNQASVRARIAQLEAAGADAPR
jgi:tetratricopeptide (TPR) repeat protein